MHQVLYRAPRATDWQPLPIEQAMHMVSDRVIERRAKYWQEEIDGNRTGRAPWVSRVWAAQRWTMKRTTSAVASYTAAVMSDTADPTWHDGHRQMPFVFVGSAATAAGGLGALAAPIAEAGPARRALIAGVTAELASRPPRTRKYTAVPQRERLDQRVS